MGPSAPAVLTLGAFAVAEANRTAQFAGMATAFGEVRWAAGTLKLTERDRVVRSVCGT